MRCTSYSENKLVLNYDHGFIFVMLCCLRFWDSLLARLYLEAPLITEEATELLKNMCGDETRAPVGLHLLQDLVIRRPPKQLTFLNALLLHTAHENLEVKNFKSLLFAHCWFECFAMPHLLTHPIWVNYGGKSQLFSELSVL